MWWLPFINRYDCYATQEIVGGSCQYYVKYKPLTEDVFQQHLEGTITLGVPALDEKGMSRWLCFDEDTEGGSLDRIQAWLTANHWRCHRESQRPGRAGHLWLFFESPIPAADLRLFAHRVLELIGVKPDAVEVFPKYDMPSFDDDKGRFKAGSLVRLPFGINRKPDAQRARGWFAGVEEDTPSQVLWFMGQPLNPVAPILEAAPQLRRLADTRKAIGGKNGQSPFAFGDPTSEDLKRIQAALNCIPPDAYSTWHQVGMAIKSAGLDLSVWESWSRKSGKYKDGDCRRKWGTFHGDKLGLGSLFYIAKQYGFNMSTVR